MIMVKTQTIKDSKWLQFANDAMKAGATTPFYLVAETQLENNLEIIDYVQRKTGARIIMALKGFSMFAAFPIIRKYLHGISASSLNEARLGIDEFGKEVHIFAPAYKEKEFKDILLCCDHVIFNSFAQWEKFRPLLERYNKSHPDPDMIVSCGMRVNVEHKEVKEEIYNPSKRFSRLGVTKANFLPNRLNGIEGLHFHNLCELNADSLQRTLEAFEEKFGQFIGQMKWINFGGGHHITREDYDVKLLCKLINDFSVRHPGIRIYLEPGEAIALNAGVLVTTVMDVVDNEKRIAILDSSFTAHIPDVLEMPYRPDIINAGKPGAFRYDYVFGGNTCLAGDDTNQMDEYSFLQPLQPGQKVVFKDMAHYTMVKNNTFNGVNLPSIIYRRSNGRHTIKRFDYEDFKGRLS
jgi:carboxynorspermidine decarboxylase